MNEDLVKDIIMKFLDGDATAHERSMLSNWLKEDPAREEVFYYYLSRRESEHPQHFPDLDTKVEDYERFLDGKAERPVIRFRQEVSHGIERPGRPNYVWWFAASFLLLMASAAYFLGDSFSYKTYSSQEGRIRSVLLADGSTVTLNANSSIRLYRDFMKHESREVWIKGEAFFEVTKKPNHMKFIVHTDNFDVEVLGTKFNINNRRCRSEVILAEGKVKLVAKDNKTLIMKPGDKVSLSNNQTQFQKQVATPEKYEAWRNNKLVFDETRLSEVAEIIQDYYGVEMVFGDSLLPRRQFTGTLPNDDLDVILVALGTAYNIDIEQRGNQILLKNKKL